MKNRSFLMALAMFLLMNAKAQNDAIIYAVGKIYNQQTKEPIVANILFQSIPYGNKVGTQKGDSFSIPLYDNEKYSISVIAEGFVSITFIFDPAAADANQKVIHDFELGLPPAPTQVAEVTPRETTPAVGKVIRLDALIFQQQSSEIGPESYPELNSVVDMLHKNPNMVIQLEGHTDFRGDAKMNMKLSEQRVNSVRNYMIGKGAAKGRIKVKALGGTMPLSRKNTEEAHRMNRRVEVRVLKN